MRPRIFSIAARSSSDWEIPPCGSQKSSRIVMKAVPRREFLGDVLALSAVGSSVALAGERASQSGGAVHVAVDEDVRSEAEGLRLAAHRRQSGHGRHEWRTSADRAGRRPLASSRGPKGARVQSHLHRKKRRPPAGVPAALAPTFLGRYRRSGAYRSRRIRPMGDRGGSLQL